MSSALLALSPAGAAVTGAAVGCGAGADSVTGAVAVAVVMLSFAGLMQKAMQKHEY